MLVWADTWHRLVLMAYGFRYFHAMILNEMAGILFSISVPLTAYRIVMSPKLPGFRSMYFAGYFHWNLFYRVKLFASARRGPPSLSGGIIFNLLLEWNFNLKLRLAGDQEMMLQWASFREDHLSRKYHTTFSLLVFFALLPALISPGIWYYVASGFLLWFPPLSTSILLAARSILFYYRL